MFKENENKHLKHNVSFCIIFLLLLTICLPFRAEASMKQTITPKSHALCNSSSDGKHHFHGIGRGRLYKGTYPNTSNCIVSNGYAFQCRYCNAVLISQYSAYYHTCLGKYAIISYPHSLQGFTCGWVSSYLTNNVLYGDAMTRGMVFE